MGVGVPELDYIFKPKRGEITLLTGIGNYGKTAWQKSQLLSRIIMYGEKIATFSPEDTPAEEYFHDYVEMLLGCECTPFNPNRPANDIYEAAYDYISKHIFYISAEMLSPTPQYIKEKFLELIVQEKVDFCCIDPFNQMTNDYKGFGGRTDKYLETLLADFSRFAKKNDVYFWVIAHPKLMERDRSGNYKCPDVFDINDGALVYKTNKVKKPLNGKMLLQTLQNYYKTDIKLAEELTKHIMDNREEQIKETIKRKVNK
jgi:hypothetical protein